MFDIFNEDEGTPAVVNSGTTTRCMRNSSRRASTSSCSGSGTGLDATDIDHDDYFSPRARGEPERKISIRHVVRSTHDNATNQLVHVHGVEVIEYEDCSPDDVMQQMETVLVDLPEPAELSRAIMTGTNLNMRLVAAGAKESFRYRGTKIEVKTWIRQAAFIYEDELQCYIRRKE